MAPTPHGRPELVPGASRDPVGADLLSSVSRSRKTSEKALGSSSVRFFSHPLCYNHKVMTQASEIPKLNTENKEQVKRTSVNSRVLAVVAAVLLLALLAGAGIAVIAMVRNPAQTETIRDIVIIFMALEALLIGLALILLIVQIARLTDLLSHEIKPILDSTNETIGTLRGTTQFLSDNLVKPVVKVNSSMAAVRRAINIIRPEGADQNE